MQESTVTAGVPHEIRALMESAHVYAGTLHAHGMRTAQLALRLASRLDVPEAECSILATAAYLHDLGKLFVPAAILCKRSSLSRDEMRIIETHPRIGEHCLRGFGNLQRISLIVGQHHERIDGRGYPEGRFGEDIDPLARILCVADAFVAMVEDRPYRPTLTAEEAVAELRRGAGRQFDPAAVEAIGSPVPERIPA